MNTNSYLNATSIQEQSRAAIAKLNADTENLLAVETVLTAFTQDSSLQSDGLNAMKLQIYDHITIMQAQRSANDSDVIDHGQLSASVQGAGIIDGDVVIAEKAAAIQDRDNDLYSADFYDQEARNTTNILYLPLKWYYQWKAGQYRDMADDDQAIHDEWLAKEELYDHINSVTSSLFFTSQDIRTSAAAGLEAIKTSFVNGNYSIDFSASWRTDLTDAQTKRVSNLDTNGNVEPDWEEIENILKKDGGEITQAEYAALAYVYANMDEAEIPHYLTLLLDEVENDIIPIDTMDHADYENGDVLLLQGSEVNQEKATRLIENLSYYYQQQNMQIYGLDPYDDEALYEEVLRNKDTLQQRMTLLGIVKDVGEFYIIDDEKYSTFTVSVDAETGEMDVSFLESYKTSGQITYTTDLEPVINLDPNVKSVDISISRSCTGDMGLTTSEYERSKLVSRFSFDFTEYAFDTGANDVVDGLLGYVPYVGPVLPYIKDAVIDSEEGSQDVQEVNASFNNVDKALMVQAFGCSANYVDIDTRDYGYCYDPSNKLIVYPGPETQEKIDRINEEYGTNISMDQLINNPDSVYEALKGPTNGLNERYNDILEGN